MRSGAELRSIGALERRLAQQSGVEHLSIRAQGCAAEQSRGASERRAAQRSGVEHRNEGEVENRSDGLRRKGEWSIGASERRVAQQSGVKLRRNIGAQGCAAERSRASEHRSAGLRSGAKWSIGASDQWLAQRSTGAPKRLGASPKCVKRI